MDEGAKWWREALGVDFGEPEEVAEQKVRVAKLPLGESCIELLEPISEDSPISKFLDKRGPGIHHIAVRVDDIRAELAKMKEKGARLIDEQRGRGRLPCGLCSSIIDGRRAARTGTEPRLVGVACGQAKMI
jgi:methylmalonyl-CoA epimerase